MKREKEIEKAFRIRVEKADGRCYKFVSPGRRGVPDRLVVMPGRPVWFAELKNADGDLRPEQVREIARLQRLGQRVEVIDSVEAAHEVEL